MGACMLGCALGHVRHIVQRFQSRLTHSVTSLVTQNYRTWGGKCACYGRRGISRSETLKATHPSADSPTSGALAEEVCCVQSFINSVPGWIAEEFCDLLLAQGAMSVVIEEHRRDGLPEQPIYATPSGYQTVGDGSDNIINQLDTTTDLSSGSSIRIWDQCAVVAYFPTVGHDDDIKALINDTMKSMFDNYGTVHQTEVTVQPVLGKDWESLIRESYQPVEIASNFWIVPLWSNNTNESIATKMPSNAKKVILEPGLAFGTGDHPTTRLCIRWLAELEYEPGLKGLRVMDYGTGSGILAVASLILGAAEAVGVDVEPLAVRAAQQNAHHNNMAESFCGLLCHPSVQGPEPLEAAGISQDNRHFDM